MSKMNTVFYGYYGYKNTGDDSFIEVAAWGARKYWNVEHTHFLTTILPKIISPATCIGRNYFKGHQQLNSIYSVFNTNIFICAGGSTFHSQYGLFNPKTIAMLKKSINPNFKFGAIGVSLGPYKSISAERENIKLLKRFDFLALRDTASYNIALSYKLPYSPVEAFDLAALLPEVYEEKSYPAMIKKEEIIGISVCNYESYIENGNIQNELRRNKQIEKLLTNIANSEKKIKFRFFIFNGNSKVGDNELTKYLINKIKVLSSINVEIINYEPETFLTWLKIRECKLVLSTRLHAAIFACFANVPFFLVEYHRKCSDFLDAVEYNHDYRMYDANIDVNSFASKMLNIIIDNKNYIKPKRLNEAINKAKLNFTQISLDD